MNIRPGLSGTVLETTLMSRTNCVSDFVAVFCFSVLFRLPDNILKLDTVLLLVSDFTAEQLATVLHKEQ